MDNLIAGVFYNTSKQKTKKTSTQDFHLTLQSQLLQLAALVESRKVGVHQE